MEVIFRIARKVTSYHSGVIKNAVLISLRMFRLKRFTAGVFAVPLYIVLSSKQNVTRDRIGKKN